MTERAHRFRGLAVPPQPWRLATGVLLGLVLPWPALWVANALEGRLPTAPFLAAIVAATLVGRLAAGVVAVTVSLGMFNVSFLDPAGSLHLDDATGIAALATFTLAALLIAHVLAMKDRALDEANRARRELASQAASERRAATERGALQRLASSLASAATVDDVLEAILHDGLEAVGAIRGVVALVTPDGRSLELRRQFGYADGLQGWSTFPIEGPYPLSEAVRTRGPVVVHDGAERDRRYPALRNAVREPDHSIVCLPILSDGPVLGGFVASFPDRRRFDELDLAFLSTVASLPAPALERARLLDSERAARRAAERAADMDEDLVRLGHDLSGAFTTAEVASAAVRHLRAGTADPRAGLALLEDGELRFVAGPPSPISGELPGADRHLEPPERRAVASMRTVVVDQLGTEPGTARTRPGHPFVSAAFVPLIQEGRPIGVLWRAYEDAADRDEREATYLETVASMTAQALLRARSTELEQQARLFADETARRISLLQELTMALTKAPALDEVGNIVARRSRPALLASGVALAVVDDEAGELAVVAADGFPEEMVRRWHRFPLDAPLPMARVARSGEPQFLANVEEWRRALPQLAGQHEPHGRAWATIPVVVDGRTAAVLGVMYGEERSFPEEERSLLTAVAEETAHAIARLESRERELRAFDRLRRLQAVTTGLALASTPREVAAVVAEQGVEVVGASQALVGLMDERGDAVRIAASSGSPTRRDELPELVDLGATMPLAEAVRTGEAVWGESEEPAVRTGAGAREGTGEAIVALPLRLAGATVGAIQLSFRADRAAVGDDHRLLDSLAALAAQALDRARAYDAELRARRETEASHERTLLLAEAGRILTSSLDYRSMIEGLAHLCMRRFADWVSIDVLEEDGRLQQLVLAHSDPERVRRLTEFRRYQPTPNSEIGTGKVLGSGEPDFIPEITDEFLARAVPDPAARETVRSFGLRSAIIVPLAVRDQVLGTLTLAYAESERRYTEEDLEVAMSLGRRAGIAIENARLYADREHLATTLQQALLPPTFPQIEGVSIAGRYLPYGKGHDVGGDFYDAFTIGPDAWGLLLGDVCGKGAEAAAIMGMARYTTRAIAEHVGRPSEVLRGLNEAMLERAPADRFCTACYVRLRRNASGFRATICLGGHEPGLVVSSDGVRPLGTPGHVLGVFEDVELTDVPVDLTCGDVLVLYTDGLIEQGRDPVDGYERLLQLLRREADGRPADDLADAILDGMLGSDRTPLRDDVALLVVALTT